MIGRRTMMLGAALTAGAVALTGAAVAWACVPSGFHGEGTVTGVKTSPLGMQAGPRGSTIALNAWQLKSRTPLTAPNDALATPATYKVLFLTSDRRTAGATCFAQGFVMKRTDTTKAQNLPAVGNGDPDPNGHDGAFTVNLRVPTYFPGTSYQIPTGKSSICGLEQTPVAGETSLPHFSFKVTAV